MNFRLFPRGLLRNLHAGEIAQEINPSKIWILESDAHIFAPSIHSELTQTKNLTHHAYKHRHQGGEEGRKSSEVQPNEGT